MDSLLSTYEEDKYQKFNREEKFDASNNALSSLTELSKFFDTNS